MIDRKTLAYALGYYKSSQLGPQAKIADHAPEEWAGDIDVQIAFRKGWVEAADAETKGVKTEAAYRKGYSEGNSIKIETLIDAVVSMSASIRGMRADLDALYRDFHSSNDDVPRDPNNFPSKGAAGGGAHSGYSLGAAGCSGASGGASGGGGGNRNVVVQYDPSIGGFAGGGGGDPTGRGGGTSFGGKPHIHLDPGKYTVENDGDNWLIKGPGGGETIQGPDGQLAHVDYGCDAISPDGFRKCPFPAKPPEVGDKIWVGEPHIGKGGKVVINPVHVSVDYGCESADQVLWITDNKEREVVTDPEIHAIIEKWRMYQDATLQKVMLNGLTATAKAAIEAPYKTQYDVNSKYMGKWSERSSEVDHRKELAQKYMEEFRAKDYKVDVRHVGDMIFNEDGSIKAVFNGESYVLEDKE